MLVASTFTMLAPHVARADNPAASALIEQGLDLRQSQHDAEALLLFEKAQALSPSPRGQAQVALAQQALGRWRLAEQNLKAALAAKSDAWIESRRPILERAMGVIRENLGDVEIVGARAGSVYVDGVRVDDPGALTHLRLEVGRRALELRSPGFYPFSRVLDVRPGAAVRVEVEQHPLLADAQPPPGSTAIVPGATPRPPSPEPAKGDAGKTQRTIGWIVLGGAAVFLATGAVGIIERESDAVSYNNSCSKGTNESQNENECNDLYSKGNTAQTVGIIGFVGAGVAGVVSATLLLTAPSAKAKGTTVSLSCTPLEGGAACAWRGTF